MAISVAGYRGIGDPGKVVELLHSSNPVIVAAAAQAAGKMCCRYALPRLEHLFTHEDPSVQETATLAALLLGSQAAEHHCRRLCQQGQTDSAHAAFYLALCGRLNDFGLFVPSGTRGTGDPQRIEAAGLLGNVEAVPFLLRILATEDDAIIKSAATALDLITGAGLREKAKITDKIDLLGGEFTEIEREVESISTSPRAWEQWWYGRRAEFARDRRWRRGKPFDIGQCLAELNDSRTGFYDRRRAGWELAILARSSMRFEPDWFVAQQMESLTAWEAWWANNNRTP
jgi:hypothetical protein